MDAHKDSDLNSDADLQPKPSRKRGIIDARLLILLLLLFYSGLAVYSNNLLPLRLVRGESMKPALVAGDIVLIRKVPSHQIEVGDIVAYRTPDIADVGGTPSAILHRVASVDNADGKRVLTTKGDNTEPDPWPVSASAVQGKVDLRIPLIGKPVLFLTSTTGIIFVSITFLLALLYIPAMVMFHFTVIKKPERSASDSTDDGEAVSDSPDGNSPVVRQEPLKTEEPAPQGKGFLGFNSLWQQSYISSLLSPKSSADERSNRLWSADEAGANSDSSFAHVAEAVEGLSAEQAEVRQSIKELSNAVSYYATNIRSHTSAVESLAHVAKMLEKSLDGRDVRDNGNDADDDV